MTIEARIERAVGLALLYELNRVRSGPTDAVGISRAWESGGGAADEIRVIARAVIEGTGSSVDVASMARKLFREPPLAVGDACDAPPPWTRPGATLRDWSGAEKVRARLAEAAREKAEARGLSRDAVVGLPGEDPIVIVGASERAFVREVGLADQVRWPHELCTAGDAADAVLTWEAAAAVPGALCEVCGVAGVSASGSRNGEARCATCEMARALGADFPVGERILWVAVAQSDPVTPRSPDGARGLIERARGRARGALAWRAIHAGLMTFLDGPFVVWLERDAIHFAAPSRGTLRALASSRGVEWLFEAAGRVSRGVGVACIESPGEVPAWRVARASRRALDLAVLRASEAKGDVVAVAILDRPEFSAEPLLVKREDWRMLTHLGERLGGVDRRTRRHLFATVRGEGSALDLAFRYAVARSPRLAEIARARGAHEVFGRASFSQCVAWAEGVSEGSGR